MAKHLQRQARNEKSCVAINGRFTAASRTWTVPSLSRGPDAGVAIPQIRTRRTSLAPPPGHQPHWRVAICRHPFLPTCAGYRAKCRTRCAAHQSVSGCRRRTSPKRRADPRHPRRAATAAALLRPSVLNSGALSRRAGKPNDATHSQLDPAGDCCTTTRRRVRCREPFGDQGLQLARDFSYPSVFAGFCGSEVCGQCGSTVSTP